MSTFNKQPAEVLDYPISAKKFLPNSDTVSVAAVSVVSPTGEETPTLNVDQIQYTSKSVVLWLSGGTDKQNYKVTALITSTEGRKVEHEILIKVRDK